MRFEVAGNTDNHCKDLLLEIIAKHFVMATFEGSKLTGSNDAKIVLIKQSINPFSVSMLKPLILYILAMTALSSCTTDKNPAQANSTPQPTALEKALDQVDSAYFIREILYLEDLQAFENRLSVLLQKQEVAPMQQLYRETVTSIDQQPADVYTTELKENCLAVIDDLERRTAFELPDLFFLWADLRTYYAAVQRPGSPEEADVTVLLSREEYSRLTAYDSPLLREAKKDKEFEFNFAYKILGKKAGKTRIAFYELTY
jgi:hypothetical protein